MTPFILMMASSFFQTRNLAEWLDDDGPASWAHAKPADLPADGAWQQKPPERALMAAE